VRRAAKRDANETAIVAALEAAGCTVARLSGAGVPDLLVKRRRTLWLMEVKDGKAGKLTPEQKVFHDRWQETHITVMRSLDDVVEWLQQETSS
jgi:hypothetical protein